MARIHLSKGCSQYGAQMGRRDNHADDQSLAIRFKLQRLYLDSGGYDWAGAYWGFGAPLFVAEGDNGIDVAELFMRASDRDHAKAIILEQYPAAKFYR
jgi:hypothetical protein